MSNVKVTVSPDGKELVVESDGVCLLRLSDIEDLALYGFWMVDLNCFKDEMSEVGLRKALDIANKRRSTLCGSTYTIYKEDGVEPTWSYSVTATDPASA